MGRASLVLALVGCAGVADREAADWWDQGTPVVVEEPILYTDQPYTFTGATPIGDLPQPTAFETWFGQDDAPPTVQCDRWSTVDALPREITGIVTIHPRFYMKVSGCQPPDDFDVDSDEKYFGSYFIEDASGGMLVLGNSRVEHFDVGARVTLRVRAIKEYFGSVMVSSHDRLEVVRGPEAVSYRTVEGRLLDDTDRAEVVRVRGTVAAPLGDFGELYLCTGDDPDLTLVQDQGRFGDFVPACAASDVADPPWYKVGIDVELQRRGERYDVGQTIEATGPVHLSFGDYQVSVLQLGQITELD